MGPWQWAIILR